MEELFAAVVLDNDHGEGGDDSIFIYKPLLGSLELSVHDTTSCFFPMFGWSIRQQ